MPCLFLPQFEARSPEGCRSSEERFARRKNGNASNCGKTTSDHRLAGRGTTIIRSDATYQEWKLRFLGGVRGGNSSRSREWLQSRKLCAAKTRRARTAKRASSNFAEGKRPRRAFTERRRREWICQRQIAEQSECRDEHCRASEHKRPPLGGASQ